MFNIKRIEQIEENLKDLRDSSKDIIHKELRAKLDLLAEKLGYFFDKEDYISTEGSGPFLMFREKVIRERHVLKKVVQSPEGNNAWRIGKIDDLGKMYDGVMMSSGTGRSIKTKTNRKAGRPKKK